MNSIEDTDSNPLQDDPQKCFGYAQRVMANSIEHKTRTFAKNAVDAFGRACLTADAWPLQAQIQQGLEYEPDYHDLANDFAVGVKECSIQEVPPRSDELRIFIESQTINEATQTLDTGLTQVSETYSERHTYVDCFFDLTISSTPSHTTADAKLTVAHR